MPQPSHDQTPVAKRGVNSTNQCRMKRDSGQTWSTIKGERAKRPAPLPGVSSLPWPGLMLLVQPDQLRISNHMAFHRFLQLCLGGLLQIRQHRIQCIELMEIAVTSYRRARPTVARAFPVIESLPCS